MRLVAALLAPILFAAPAHADQAVTEIMTRIAAHNNHVIGTPRPREMTTHWFKLEKPRALGLGRTRITEVEALNRISGATSPYHKGQSTVFVTLMERDAAFAFPSRRVVKNSAVSKTQKLTTEREFLQWWKMAGSAHEARQRIVKPEWIYSL